MKKAISIFLSAVLFLSCIPVCFAAGCKIDPLLQEKIDLADADTPISFIVTALPENAPEDFDFYRDIVLPLYSGKLDEAEVYTAKEAQPELYDFITKNAEILGDHGPQLYIRAKKDVFTQLAGMQGVDALYMNPSFQSFDGKIQKTLLLRMEPLADTDVLKLVLCVNAPAAPAHSDVLPDYTAFNQAAAEALAPLCSEIKISTNIPWLYVKAQKQNVQAIAALDEVVWIGDDSGEWKDLEAPRPGDLNGSGSIEAGDARIALRISVGLEEKTDAALAIGDMNRDGKITAADARTILRMAVGLPV